MWRSRAGVRYVEWSENPTPDDIPLSGTVILDAGVYEYSYLYDASSDRTAWLQFDGELSDIER